MTRLALVNGLMLALQTIRSHKLRAFLTVLGVIIGTGTIIGVFISITTIPAAADIGVSSAFGFGGEALGSFYQLLLNVGLLIIVGALTMRGQRLIWRRWLRARGEPG